MSAEKKQMSNAYKMELSRRLKQADHVLLVLDDDGTLGPVLLDAGPVEVPESVQEALVALAQSPDVTVVIMSGHSMLQMKKNFPIENVVLAANHGLEVEGGPFLLHHKLAESSRQVIHRCANTLRTHLSRTNGVSIDDRGLNAFLNYRMVREELATSLLAKARNLVGQYVRDRQVRLVTGHKAIEILPPVDWGRGKAVRTMLHELRKSMPDKRVLALYFGDDIMDEDGFKFVNQTGLTWRVGRDNASCAHFFLKTQAEILGALKGILSQLPKLGSVKADAAEAPQEQPGQAPAAPAPKPRLDRDELERERRTVTLDDFLRDTGDQEEDDSDTGSTLPKGTRIIL